MGELQFSCSLWDVVGPPSSLSDEGLEDMLEGFDEATSRVVLRASSHDFMHNTC
jgi:hypothetical protein